MERFCDIKTSKKINKTQMYSYLAVTNSFSTWKEAFKHIRDKDDQVILFNNVYIIVNKREEEIWDATLAL